jgi:hypothetical protein
LKDVQSWSVRADRLRGEETAEWLMPLGPIEKTEGARFIFYFLEKHAWAVVSMMYVGINGDGFAEFLGVDGVWILSTGDTS